MTNDEIKTLVDNASPGKLIELLYDKALKDLKIAADLFDKTDAQSYADGLQHITYARYIINVLNQSLNCNAKDNSTKDLANNLRKIYEYVQDRLSDAIVERRKDPIVEVIGLLSELHKTWELLVSSGVTSSQELKHICTDASTTLK